MGYYVKPIVCDYGVYNDYNNELCLVCNRKANAELIVKILQVDNGDDAEHHHDKVCRDYKSDYTRKPLERIMDRLKKLREAEYDDSDEEPEYRDFDDIFDDGVSSGKFKAYHKAIEIVKEEME